MLPALGEVIGLGGRLVDEVPALAVGDAAEEVRPRGGGPDLARLWQGDLPDVVDPGEQGVHLRRHLPPRCRGGGVGVGWGGLAGGVAVPARPHQSTATVWGLPVSVFDSKRARRWRWRRCEQSGGCQSSPLPPRRAGLHNIVPVSSCHSGSGYQRHV